MKKTFNYTFLIPVLTVFLLVTTSAFAQELENPPRALFQAINYYHPEEGAYVEFILSFDAMSLEYKQINNYYQARLEVLYVIKKGPKVVKYQKFEILSPQMMHASNRQDFADLQTITLKPDVYTVEISIWDVNRDIKPVEAVQSLVVNLKKEEMGLSKVAFQREVFATEEEGPFIKNGVSMTPWLVSTIPAYMSSIYLYAEAYNSDYELGKEGAYVEKHTLRNLDVDSVFQDHSVMKRVYANNVNIILKKLDVTNLPQGSYSYLIELFNRSNELVASNGIQFYRESLIPTLVNKKASVELKSFEAYIRSTTNRDSIVDFVRCVRPMANTADQNYIDFNWDKGSSDALQMFLINMWKEQYPENTFVEWNKYRQMVKVVDKEFGSAAKPGYDTDQGMTYLKYGAPDQITDRSQEPSSYPYVIWQYYAHPKQSNAMYVFYDPSLTYRDYELLHSNVRDEKNNARWKLILQSRNNANGDVDKSDGVEHWGGQVDDYYTNPR